MPDVRGERRIVFVVSEFDEDRCLLVVWGKGMNSQFAEPPAEIDQIIGCDFLIAKDYQLVLDQRVLNSLERLICQRLAKVDTADLGTKMDSDTSHSDAVAFDGDRPTMPGVHWFIHERPPPFGPAPGISELLWSDISRDRLMTQQRHPAMVDAAAVYRELRSSLRTRTIYR